MSSVSWWVNFTQRGEKSLDFDRFADLDEKISVNKTLFDGSVRDLLGNESSFIC